MSASRLAALALCLALSSSVHARAQGAVPATTQAMSFEGRWQSAADSDQRLFVIIRPTGPAMVGVLAERRFEAQGFLEDSAHVVALARTSWRGEGSTPPTRYFLLRLERVDATTMRARVGRDLADAAGETETWRYVGPLPERRAVRRQEPVRPPDAEIVPPGDSDLPAFGEYVYVEELPEAVVKVPPSYPDAARAHGIEGQVLIQVLVGKDGLVKDTRLVKSISELDAAADACVRQWRFKPALSGNRPVAVWIAIPVKFTLH